MLLRFACSNFKSIKDRQEILFTAAKGVKNLPDAPRTVEGYKKNQLLPVIAVYGANASGKSNMLEALAFIKRAALRSHVDWENGIPRKPFRLDPACADLPSTFDIDFLIGSTRYHYGFSVDDEKVLEEWLYAVKPGRAQQVWFERKAGEKTEYGGPIKAEAVILNRITRSASLILTSLFETNGSDASKIRRYVDGEIEFYNDRARVLGTFDLSVDAEKWVKIRKMMGLADTGITDIHIKNSIINGVITKKEPIFFHNGDINTPFHYDDESNGTVSFFRMAGNLLTALERGQCFCVDELETSLHPHLAQAIIRLFMTPETNPDGAQLFFATHDTNLLGKDIVRRDQVWLTEKDKGGATHVYPLSDFKIPEGADVERAYLDGRFGGVPFLPSWMSLLGREG
jgi:uncharacterized protein